MKLLHVSTSALLAAAIGSSFSGCALRLYTTQEAEAGASPGQAMQGVPYMLPRTELYADVSMAAKEFRFGPHACAAACYGVQPMSSGLFDQLCAGATTTPVAPAAIPHVTTTGVTIVAESVADRSAMYRFIELEGRALIGRTLKVNVDSRGVLTSIGATATDERAGFVTEIARTAVELAGSLVGLTPSGTVGVAGAASLVCPAPDSPAGLAGDELLRARRHVADLLSVNSLIAGTSGSLEVLVRAGEAAVARAEAPFRTTTSQSTRVRRIALPVPADASGTAAQWCIDGPATVTATSGACSGAGVQITLTVPAGSTLTDVECEVPNGGGLVARAPVAGRVAVAGVADVEPTVATVALPQYGVCYALPSSVRGRTANISAQFNPTSGALEQFSLGSEAVEIDLSALTEGAGGLVDAVNARRETDAGQPAAADAAELAALEHQLAVLEAERQIACYANLGGPCPEPE